MLRERIFPQPVQCNPKITIWRTVFRQESSLSDWSRCANFSYYLILDLPCFELYLLSGRPDGCCANKYQADLVAIGYHLMNEGGSWDDQAFADILGFSPNDRREFEELIYFDSSGEPTEGLMVEQGLIDSQDLISRPGNDIFDLAQFKPEAPELIYGATHQALSRIAI